MTHPFPFFPLSILTGCVSRLARRVSQPLLLLALVVSIAPPLTAQTVLAPTASDPSWGGGFRIGFTDMIDDSLSGRGVSLFEQNDGKILILATCLPKTQATGGGNGGVCVRRVNRDGTPDASYGVGGLATASGAPPTIGSTPFQFIATVATALLQPDGAVLVVGRCYPSPCVIRIDPSGKLDTRWGPSSRPGVADIDLFADTGKIPLAAVLQADGQVVVLSSCDNRLCMARLSKQGVQDQSFPNGSNGLYYLPKNMGATSLAFSQFDAQLVQQPDSKLLVAASCGTEGDTTRNSFCLLRLDSAGQIDTTFSSSWLRTAIVPDTTGSALATSLMLRPDGQIVVGGSCSNPQAGTTAATRRSICLARYSKESGRLNVEQFGTNGFVFDQPTTGENGATGGLMQADGRIIQAGICASNNCYVRYHPDGTVDTSFRIAFLGAPSNYSLTQSAALQQRDGKLLFAGNCVYNSAQGLCISRYVGGPYTQQRCLLDIEGDGKIQATTDALLLRRALVGVDGSALLNSLEVPAGATRSTGAAVREHLIDQCGISIPSR